MFRPYLVGGCVVGAAGGGGGGVREHTLSYGDQLSCEGGSGSGRSSAADWGYEWCEEP